MRHLTLDELMAGVAEIRRAPRQIGRVDLICRRPVTGEREELEEAQFDPVEGLVGDNWRVRGSTRTADGAAHPEMQINLMGSRAAALVAVTAERRRLAGDQLFIDLDLSGDNLPPGTSLELGTAVLEITSMPHRGCAKFTARYGLDAMRWVNSEVGRALNLRGVCARVVTSGRVRGGDEVRRVPAAAVVT